MKILFMADTNNEHHKIPYQKCDVLMHAGGATVKGTIHEFIEFIRWFDAFPAGVKIFVPALRDSCIWQDDLIIDSICHEHRSVHMLSDNHSIRLPNIGIVRGLNTGICPSSRLSFSMDTVAIISHVPAKNLLDIDHYGNHVGSDALRQRLDQDHVGYPMFLVSGLAHASYGTASILQRRNFSIAWVVNASLSESDDGPVVRPPIEINI